MDSSDIHLENALEEYNDRVNELEAVGIENEELLEAYVNRGCVLYMMEYRTSAMDDLDTASDILEGLRAQGCEPDVGTYVRIHATKAAILFDQEGDCTYEYELVSKVLGELDQHSRHFDQRSLVSLCIDATKNLIDSESSDVSLPFIERGMRALRGHHDAWSQNRAVELLDLHAEAMADLAETQESVELYSQSIDLAIDLMDREQLEDPEELVMAFVMRAEGEADLGLMDPYINDIESAITILEHMVEFNRMPDPDILMSLHHDVAGALMKVGRVADAEKHLMKAMRIGVQGAGDRTGARNPGD